MKKNASGRVQLGMTRAEAETLLAMLGGSTLPLARACFKNYFSRINEAQIEGKNMLIFGLFCRLEDKLTR